MARGLKAKLRSREAGFKLAPVTANHASSNVEEANRAMLSKSERTRRQVLDAAAKVIRDNGYTRTRLQDIVASVGIHPASIYYHFSSKDAIVREVISLAISNSFRFIRDSVDALPPSALALDKIVTAIFAQMRIIMELSDYVAAAWRIMAEEPEGIYAAFRAEQRAFLRFWDDLLRTAKRDGQLRPDANLPLVRALLVGAMGWRIEYYTGGKLSSEEVAYEIVQTFLGGISNEKYRRRILADAAMVQAKSAVERAASTFRV